MSPVSFFWDAKKVKFVSPEFLQIGSRKSLQKLDFKIRFYLRHCSLYPRLDSRIWLAYSLKLAKVFDHCRFSLCSTKYMYCQGYIKMNAKNQIVVKDYFFVNLVFALYNKPKFGNYYWWKTILSNLEKNGEKLWKNMREVFRSNVLRSTTVSELGI